MLAKTKCLTRPTRTRLTVVVPRASRRRRSSSGNAAARSIRASHSTRWSPTAPALVPLPMNGQPAIGRKIVCPADRAAVDFLDEWLGGAGGMSDTTVHRQERGVRVMRRLYVPFVVLAFGLF